MEEVWGEKVDFVILAEYGTGNRHHWNGED